MVTPSFLSDDHNLPLRTFYSLQINQVPKSEEVMAIYDLGMDGIPTRYLRSEDAIAADSLFQSNIDPKREWYGQTPATEINREEARESWLDYQEDLDPLRRSPILRLLVQSGDESALRIFNQVLQLTWNVAERAEEFEEEFYDEFEDFDPEYIEDSPEDVRNRYFGALDSFRSEIEEGTRTILNSPETMKLILKLQDEQCKIMFDEKRIKDAFCQDFNPPDSYVRDIILPEVMVSLDHEDDMLGPSMATNELYCNPFREETSSLYSEMDLSSAFPSFLEQIATNSSQEFALFDQEVAPIISQYMADGALTEEEKESLIPQLTDLLVRRGGKDIWGYHEVAEDEFEIAEARAYAESLLRGESTAMPTFMVDRGLAETLRGIIERPAEASGEQVHEQQTVAGVFGESQTGESGLAANYALSGTDEDRERARLIATELEQAEAEGQIMARPRGHRRPSLII